MHSHLPSGKSPSLGAGEMKPPSMNRNSKAAPHNAKGPWKEQPLGTAAPLTAKAPTEIMMQAK
ncbi:GD21936 [Drosophila simulans]|uniref:GD21936 n=1 Tax=Drosophila simulans TaxID=7240 RepID=B4Q6I5_DROSI|nr:GD21936 [Drosophila simulans]